MKSFSYYIQTSVVVHVEALLTAYFFSDKLTHMQLKYVETV